MAEDKNIITARKIAREASLLGGRVFYVGGFVRDRLMERENKDVDIEVHGITVEQLEGILDRLGTRMQMGSSFGVYGLKGCDIDIAMPRMETAVGRGHKDFRVEVDPFIGTERAAIRRDFTMNAMMQDVLTGEIVDHFHGQEDIKNGIIRHVNDKSFTEDALRVLRAAQFASRFEFDVAPETVELCRDIDLSLLSRERVFEELRKALLKAERPSVFFEVLREMEQLSVWFPEAERMIGVEQSPRFHMEGDVWNHTMAVLDASAGRRDNVSDKTAFMLSALTHDFGKIICSEKINGEIHSYNHEVLGLPLIEEFIKRLTDERSLRRYVLNMAELHMKPNMMIADHSSIKATNRLFDKSVAPADLIELSAADNEGSITANERYSREPYLRERLAVFEEYMSRPYVAGADLIAAGFKPGKNFKEILDYAHKLRLAGIDKESALTQTLKYAEAVKEPLI